MSEACACPAEAGAGTCERTVPPSSAACPSCGHAGKAIDTLTVKALLALPLTALEGGDGAYRFCRTPHCAVVYFTADGRQRFTEADLRERVHQKHAAEADVLVCYCFRHTPGSIKAEAEATGESTAVAAITAGIQAGQCACEVRNPQGSCCLGNVRAVVDRLAAATG
jgi:hypothetical protein